MPAKAGIQNYLKTLDSRLRGNDIKGRFKTIYESIIIPLFHCSIIPIARSCRWTLRLLKGASRQVVNDPN